MQNGRSSASFYFDTLCYNAYFNLLTYAGMAKLAWLYWLGNISCQHGHTQADRYVV